VKRSWTHRKGKEFEREVARCLAEIFGERFVRRGVKARGGGAPADVVVPALWIECKAQRRTDPRAALRQASRGGRADGRWPVAVCKDDGQQAHAMMTFEDFLALLREWHERRMEWR
jgi:hypothetical protein